MRSATDPSLVPFEPFEMNRTLIEAIDASARRQFTYKADAPGIANNLWRSFGDAVLQNRPWQGDCSDLASTVLDLLERNGMDLSDQYRLVVISGVDGDVPDHLVGCVQDTEGDMLIVGDTFTPDIYSAQSIKHKAYIYNRMSEAAPPIWRQGFPWEF